MTVPRATGLVRPPVDDRTETRSRGQQLLIFHPVVVSFLAGLGFRRRFRGDGVVFHLMIGSLVAPGLVLGIGMRFQFFGLEPSWTGSALDLGATRWQTIRFVVIPILLPGLVAVALLGFTLSYDEFPRTLQTSGSLNTLPVEIWTMTLNVTSPSLYSLGTVTTAVSFLIIGLCLGSIARMQKRRAARTAGR
ncbi:MAG: ABC transporter permease subunit [Burkholderiales bacterium]